MLYNEAGVTVSDLDVAKEKIGFLKLWMGILVVSDISLAGWLVVNGASAHAPIRFGGVAALLAVAIVIILLHKRIARLIESLGDL